MITISTSAQKHFILLLSKEPVDTQIRIFVTNPGTSYAECGVAYCLKNEIERSDVKIKYDNFNVYINKDFIPYLKNAEIDLIVDNLGSQLTLKAPYSKKNISDKKTILEQDIQNFLDLEINPYLLSHGGRVDLIKVTHQEIANIYFSGGCNGCNMIQSTLKNMIEKKILSHFLQIKKIRDKTLHIKGKHSFY